MTTSGGAATLNCPVATRNGQRLVDIVLRRLSEFKSSYKRLQEGIEIGVTDSKQMFTHDKHRQSSICKLKKFLTVA